MTVDEAKRNLCGLMAIDGLPHSVRKLLQGILTLIEKQQRRIKNQARELTKLKTIRENK